MKKVYILYNPKSGNGTGRNEADKINKFIDIEKVYLDITKIDDYKTLFNGLEREDIVVIAGGDGTLSRFVTDIANVEIKNPIYYYATGSGNDFLKDLGYVKGDKPFPINDYIQNLPVMSVNSKEYCFVNGGGGGLDAYACVKGNEMHEKGKKANYVAAAIKGILYDYTPMNVTVTIDGEKKEYKNVWFASVMKGRYFGGGIMLAPKQNRNSDSLSLVIIHTVGRLRLLPIIPGAFEGKHVKYTQYVTVLEGKDIEVNFDRSVSIQIDGETQNDVMSYRVKMPILSERA